ncbi:DVA-1 polyprotein [Toxocara canis]|uniref:DVA-1 polyprotein n=1 Tax=Toxocara canis TaxID=6265 RepID=A0A0B2VW26_TOXCA|nr:DVA-1 polyprotein [Toxocara canis]
MILWQFAWLALVLGSALARPPGESIETVRTIANAEDRDVSKKIRSVQWEVDAEKEMNMGLFDFFGRSSRHRRSYELHDWMTETQKQEIRSMESANAAPLEIKKKLIEFFEQLPTPTKETWNAKYKEECAQWVKTVASKEEIAELEELKDKKDFKTLHEKLAIYKTRLGSEERAKVELWKDVCKKLWGVEVKEETLRRLRRALAQYRDYLHWMTDEQFKAIENMKEEGASTQQLHAKVKEYFKKLPMEKQEMIKNEFKTKCVAWIKDVATDEQIEELKTLHHDGDLTTLHAKIDSYFAKLSSPRQDEVGRLRALCKEAWGVSAPSRTRREIDAKYKEWIAWMTDAQRSELESMRAGGSSFDEIHEKINGYFKELEADRRKELIKEYKAKCKEYFAAISTEDEMNEVKKLYESGEERKATDIIDTIIDRQPEDKRKQAKTLKKVCYDVYHKAAARRMRRRDIDALMNKHLSWLTDEQKHQIKRMKQDGESTGSIKAKLMNFLKELEEDEQKKAAEKTKQSCYAWLHDVATKEERDELEQLHHQDHAACKKKVREYVQRLSPEKQAAVNRDLDICEHIWYGGHVHNSHHRHLRRHLTG